MITRLLVCLAMVFALAGALPGTVRAEWDDRPEPAEYEENLSPHGYWVDDPGFGRVWRPYMHWDWRPYVDGQWIWTSYGWTWSSPEPWGWTFHYGRWGFSNVYGWVWTPGYVWGPAWVDWYWGDGYVGWVPLAPAGFTIVPSYWTYVHTYSFCAPRINNVVIVHNHLPRHVFRHRDYGWGHRRAPDFRDIEHVSRHRIVRASDRPRDTVAPWVRQRVDRGERVREHVVDRGRERVLEHGGGRLSDAGGRRDRPHVAVDDWRRGGDRDDHGGAGRMVDRRDDGRLGEDRRNGRGMQHGSDRDRDGGGRIIEVPRGRVDTRRNLDADRNTVRPGRGHDDGTVFTRERGAPERS
jgi:hypothetical protein